MPIRSWPPKCARAWRAKLAEITPGDIDAFFFTNGGAEANENAIRIARMFSGPSQDWRTLSLIPWRHGRQL